MNIKMSARMKVIVGILIFAFLIVGATIAYNTLGEQLGQNGDAQATQGEKQKAPDFTVTDESGKEIKLSDMMGKPVVLNFWASWCPPCKSEMPEFDKVYKDLGGEVEFMMVDLADGQRETVEMGAKYVKGQGFAFPVYFDTLQEGANAYDVMYIPSTIFIDKDGYVVATAQGAMQESELRKNIELCL